MWIYLAAFLGALVVSSNAQTHSPCPGLFQYVSQKPGLWEGDLTLLSDSELHGVWVRLLFDTSSTELTVANEFGQVVTSDHLDYLLKNREYKLKAGVPVKVRISVKYEGDKAPKLVGFRLNAKTVCPEHGGEFNFVDSGSSQSSNEFFLGDLNNKNFLANRPQGGVVTGCGTAPLFPGGSNSGKSAEEGQWPWHAAIYLSRGNEQKNICSATLISATHVITAAHCVTPKNAETSLNPDILKIRVGEHFTGAENKGMQEVHALSIKLHPGYNAINYDNDVAIIRLDKAVTLTDYVRPVCLWEEAPNDQSVLRREGVVVGLGFDSEGRYTDRIAQSPLQVAPNDVCLNSNLQLAPFLSQKTFCAKYVKGNALCVGESGSGVAFLSEGAKPLWQLRGLITVGAGLQNKLVCDASTFVVVADLAKHNQWIKSTTA